MKLLFLSVLLVLVVSTRALDPVAEGGDKSDVVVPGHSLAGDISLNYDWDDSEEEYEDYDWENWARDLNAEDTDDVSRDSDEGHEADYEEGAMESTVAPSAIASSQNITINATESATVGSTTQATSNLAMTEDSNVQDYNLRESMEEDLYDEQKPIVEVEIEFSKNDHMKPQVSSEWPAEVPEEMVKINKNMKDEVTADPHGDENDWTLWVRDWKNYENGERIKRVQTLYTGILIGFFALTVAVVLFSFYRGFVVCSSIMRRTVTVGEGYRRMEEEPVLKQCP